MPTLTMAVLFFVFLIVPWNPVHASFLELLNQDKWAVLAGRGALIILSLLGRLMGFVIDMILTVASYNKFIEAPAVVQGWKVVRDLGNMAFIIVLLMIGFGTMFGLQKFEIGQWLPKVALYSILVNFSRSICGVLIDASQVVMLTFVNAFKEAGAGNFVNAMGLDKIMALADNKASQGVDVTTEVLIAILLGIIVTTLALGVLGALLVFLLERVIGLWILVALSPIAFILKAIPVSGAANLASQWWKKFSNYLTSGPILAFFLWLALAISSGVGPEADKNLAALQGIQTGQGNVQTSDFGKGTIPGAGDIISGIGNAQGLLSFIISAAMLVAGMTVAKKSGSFAGSFVSKFQGKGGLASLGLGAGGLGRYVAGLGPVGSWVGKVGGGYAKPLTEAWKSFQKRPSELGERGGLATVGLLAGAPAILGGREGRQAKKKLEDMRKGIIADEKGTHDDKNKGRTDNELINVLQDQNVKAIEKLSAIEELMRRNLLKEDNNVNRSAVNEARKFLEDTPGLLKEFEEKVMKASPDLAAGTIFNEIRSQADANAIFTAISTGQMELSKVLSKFSPDKIGRLIKQIGSTEEFHKRVGDGTKDVGEYKQLVSGLNTDRRKLLFDGKEDTFEIIGERYYKGLKEERDIRKFWNDVENNKIDLTSALKGFTGDHVDKLSGFLEEGVSRFQERISGAVKDVHEYMTLVNALPKDRQEKVFGTKNAMEAVAGHYYKGFKDKQGKADPDQVNRLKADVESGRIDFSDFIKGLKDLPEGKPGALETQVKNAFNGYGEMMKFMAENARDVRYFAYWLNNIGKTKANRITETENTMQAVVKYMYSGFEDAQGQPDPIQADRFRNDIESRRINLKEFLGDITKDKDMIEKLADASGGFNKLGTFIVDQSWDDRELENILDSMNKESVQSIIEGMSPGDFAEDDERLKFGLATRGRFDKSFDLKSSDHARVVIENIKDGKIKGQDIIKLTMKDLLKAVSPGDPSKILEAMVRSFDSRSFAIIERNGDEDLLNELLGKVVDDLKDDNEKIRKRAEGLRKGLIKAYVIDGADPKYNLAGGTPSVNNPDNDQSEDQEEEDEDENTT